MGAKNGLPDFVYDATVVSQSEKNQAREIIKQLKKKFCLFRNEIILPLQMCLYHFDIL